MKVDKTQWVRAHAGLPTPRHDNLIRCAERGGRDCDGDANSARHQEFLRFFDRIDESVETGLEVHWFWITLDN